MSREPGKRSAADFCEAAASQLPRSARICVTKRVSSAPAHLGNTVTAQNKKVTRRELRQQRRPLRAEDGVANYTFSSLKFISIFLSFLAFFSNGSGFLNTEVLKVDSATAMEYFHDRNY